MKYQTIILCLALGFMSLTAHAVNSAALGKTKSKIELKGKPPKPTGPRSLIEAITALHSESDIEVSFRMQGDVEVIITDSDGSEVYSTMLNTNAQNYLLIPLMGFAEGIYHISFMHDEGELYGEFEL